MRLAANASLTKRLHSLVAVDDLAGDASPALLKTVLGTGGWTEGRAVTLGKISRIPIADRRLAAA